MQKNIIAFKNFEISKNELKKKAKLKLICLNIKDDFKKIFEKRQMIHFSSY